MNATETLYIARYAHVQKPPITQHPVCSIRPEDRHDHSVTRFDQTQLRPALFQLHLHLSAPVSKATVRIRVLTELNPSFERG
eukprot:2824763-Amphidinium_carterae.1